MAFALYGWDFILMVCSPINHESSQVKLLNAFRSPELFFPREMLDLCLSLSWPEINGYYEHCHQYKDWPANRAHV